MRRRTGRCAPPLPRAHLLMLLAVLAVVLLPHATHLPAWISALAGCALLWRAGAVLRGWPLPGTTVRATLAVIGLAGVYASFGRISGQTAGVALLVVMTALKLTELRGIRDGLVLVLLMYFMLITHFLFSQEPWAAAFLLGCATLITAVAIRLQHPREGLPARASLRLATVMIAQALPLMLVMFLLFPRIPGPLWGLPSDAGGAIAGLADSMAPGDIERVVRSGAVAFRVSFDGTVPPPALRYWRGPVFATYDGHRWTPGLGVTGAAPALTEAGPAYEYQITLEPSHQRWLFALDLPDTENLPAGARLGADATLRSDHALDQRRLYRLRSYPRYRLQPQITPAQRNAFLQLPRATDPRARKLAEGWRAQNPDDAGVIAAALRYFRRNGFRYTLTPPPLDRQPIDDFLFRTHAGFCEHYAGSFTFLMRAAGIPARVVTGYLGGARNPVGGYLVVRASDAHAWSEVWLAGSGWLRVDPTAAVSPARIEDGIDAALPDAAGLSDYLDAGRNSAWLYRLQARWDWLNAQWNRWVLAYGPELQQRVMAWLGLAGWGGLILMLTAAVGLLLAALGLALLYGARPRRADDPLLNLWQRALRRLARLGLRPAPGEGPRDFLARAAAERPELERPLQRLGAAYLGARYLGTAGIDELQRALTLITARRGWPRGRRTAA
ncbi:MAG: DUF3488 domain-containing transglutaminase family protein [Gammaproteobacteria bacterium]|nr:DUF3488 domain-containing transglutaminase family protein [Gammaproteobacteria bacterium]